MFTRRNAIASAASTALAALVAAPGRLAASTAPDVAAILADLIDRVGGPDAAIEALAGDAINDIENDDDERCPPDLTPKEWAPYAAEIDDLERIQDDARCRILTRTEGPAAARRYRERMAEERAWLADQRRRHAERLAARAAE